MTTPTRTELVRVREATYRPAKTCSRCKRFVKSVTTGWATCRLAFPPQRIRPNDTCDAWEARQ